MLRHQNDLHYNPNHVVPLKSNLEHRMQKIKLQYSYNYNMSNNDTSKLLGVLHVILKVLNNYSMILVRIRLCLFLLWKIELIQMNSSGFDRRNPDLWTQTENKLNDKYFYYSFYLFK